MKADNKWHDGIVYQVAGEDGFVLVENLEALAMDARPKTMENGQVKYNEVKWNWNKGQPIVKFEEFQASIVDIDSVA